MNESLATRNVNKRVETTDGEVIVWKVSDRYNAGRPDCHYLKQRPVYIEYKFVRAAKLPSRHTPALSGLQQRELRALHKQQPNTTRVIVIFQVQRDLIFVEYEHPDQWESSVPLVDLQHHCGYTQMVQRIIELVSF